MSTIASAEPTATCGGYSRVTVVGRRHRIDIAIPSEEPMGTVLADLLAVLDEKPDGRAVNVVTGTGVLIGADTSLAAAGIEDGTLLRIVVIDEVPPPPVVNDITEETAADADRHPGRWSDRARYATAVAAVAVAAATAAWEALIVDTPAGRTTIAVAVGVFAFGYAGFMVAGRAWPASASAVAAGVLGGGLLIVDGGSAGHWAAPDVGGGLVLIGWLMTLSIAIVWRDRGWLAGAAIGALLAGGWLALRRTGLTSAEVDALLAALTVAGFGALPRWALTASGLAALDDSRLVGGSVSRVDLRRSLTEAHRIVIGATAAVCVSSGITGVLLAARGEPWPAGLAAAAALVVALRARTLPLIAEVAGALTAATAIGVVLVTRWARQDLSAGWPMAVTGVLGVAAGSVLLLDPAPHTRARLRALADRVEAIAVIALLPVLIGVFGVYGRLLHTF
jgi:type VII secretion integral membrane protein EccD